VPPVCVSEAARVYIERAAGHVDGPFTVKTPLELTFNDPALSASKTANGQGGRVIERGAPA
jgi:hypothetical protein